MKRSQEVSRDCHVEVLRPLHDKLLRPLETSTWQVARDCTMESSHSTMESSHSTMESSHSTMESSHSTMESSWDLLRPLHDNLSQLRVIKWSRDFFAIVCRGLHRRWPVSIEIKIMKSDLLRLGKVTYWDYEKWPIEIIKSDLLRLWKATQWNRSLYVDLYIQRQWNHFP